MDDQPSETQTGTDAVVDVATELQAHLRTAGDAIPDPARDDVAESTVIESAEGVSTFAGFDDEVDERIDALIDELVNSLPS